LDTCEVVSSVKSVNDTVFSCSGQILTSNDRIQGIIRSVLAIIATNPLNSFDDLRMGDAEVRPIFHSSATLIVCRKIMVKHWKDAAKQRLGKTPDAIRLAQLVTTRNTIFIPLSMQT
jgi:hypothetical protein